MNATRYVATPLTRLATHVLDASGAGSWPISVQPSMVGTTLFYQGYFRDPQALDGTGAGVSNALRVVFFD